jgi:hypothetical protein
MLDSFAQLMRATFLATTILQRGMWHATCQRARRRKPSLWAFDFLRPKLLDLSVTGGSDDSISRRCCGTIAELENE